MHDKTQPTKSSQGEFKPTNLIHKNSTHIKFYSCTKHVGDCYVRTSQKYGNFPNAKYLLYNFPRNKLLRICLVKHRNIQLIKTQPTGNLNNAKFLHLYWPTLILASALYYRKKQNTNQIEEP